MSSAIKQGKIGDMIIAPAIGERKGARIIEVQVPASTSNLGAGFDCCGLALKLYLTVRATVTSKFSRAFEIQNLGAGNNGAPRGKTNLIYRAMQFVARRERLVLPPVRLDVRSEIPFASGLGSSGAAIIAGISLCASFCKRELSKDKILRYATEIEGHADNVAAALLGGFVVHCIKADGEVLTVKKFWPSDLKIIAVTPHIAVDTKHARRILPETVSRRDAVYNLQRTALFGAALEQQAYDLLWEAMRDRLHQAQRATLVPGLAEALATPRMEGLHAVALSGSGPTVIALASDHFTEIGDLIANCFRKHELETQVRVLEVDPLGLRVFVSARADQVSHGNL